MELVAFWFRRDLRLEDNTALFHALNSGKAVLPVFIFDTSITNHLPGADPRVTFIHDQLTLIQQKLTGVGSTLLVKHGTPIDCWEELISTHDGIRTVYTNHDYEPYALERDEKVKVLLESHQIEFKTFKDQVIFEKDEVVKDDGKPYTVYTPYKNKWLKKIDAHSYQAMPSENSMGSFWRSEPLDLPSLASMGFERSNIQVKPHHLGAMDGYDSKRDIPALEATSYLSPHLRFGTVSVRRLAQQAAETNETFLSELIWREFFMQILYHFPHVVGGSFRKQYDQIKWENNEKQFAKWCQGKTGYPMIDAGMRELNETGYMHNRVRMVVASFLTKHLLIDWRWGEAYFAEKLLDFELSSNNGNWQWAAGSGCDASPYFRVFNPTSQLKKFDPQMKYCKKWLGNDIGKYPPIVEHSAARLRAIDRYKTALGKA